MSNDRKTAPSAAELMAARRAAAKDLKVLFGGKTAEGQVTKGVLHEHSLANVIAQPSWADFINGVRKNQHAKTVAVIACTHGDERYPPALVAELFSDEEQGHDPKWFAEVFLGGLLEVFVATNGTVGIMLPPTQTGIDMIRAAFNVFDHLSDEEGTRLSLSMPNKSKRRQLATDLDSILEESATFGTAANPALTPAQQLYRWAMRGMDKRNTRDDEPGAGGVNEDPASGLKRGSKPAATPDPRVELNARLEAAKAAKKAALANEDGAALIIAQGEIAQLGIELAALDATKPNPPANAAPAATPATSTTVIPTAPPAPPAASGGKPPKKRGLLRTIGEVTGITAPPAPPTPTLPPPPTAAASVAPPNTPTLPPPPPAVADPATPPASPTATATTATVADDEQELVLTALLTAAEKSGDKKLMMATAAMKSLVMTGGRTLDQAIDFAKSKGLRLPGIDV